MKFAFLTIWKRRYRKATIAGIILIGSILAFWFGLRAALGTASPLLPVDSASMSPALNCGDLIIVQGVKNACDIELGDIIVFHEPTLYGDRLIIFRAVDKTITDGACYFRTKGDASPSDAPWDVAETHIVGRCIGRIPWLGHVSLFIGEKVLPFLSTPVGLLTVVVAALGTMLLQHAIRRKMAGV